MKSVAAQETKVWDPIWLLRIVTKIMAFGVAGVVSLSFWTWSSPGTSSTEALGTSTEASVAGSSGSMSGSFFTSFFFGSLAVGVVPQPLKQFCSPQSRLLINSLSV